MGTVMGWVDKKGVKHQTLVLDAKYREVLAYGISKTVSGMAASGALWYLDTGTTSSGKRYNNVANATTVNDFPFKDYSDSKINNFPAYWEDPNTSNQNTTLLYNNGFSAIQYGAGWCRSKKVKGTACDFPNIQTLIRIYCSMFKLDELDPTPKGHRMLFTKARSGYSYNWYFGGRNFAAWSSSSRPSLYPYGVGNTDCGSPYVEHIALIDTSDAQYCGAIIPILEL